MFFIPINTDAPIYHFPWATVSLIVANTLAFFAAAAGVVHVESYVLTYGTGLHPLQWVTSLFLHDGLLHLAANMACLWVFGLIVEGKLGWRGFLPVFLGLGIVESALEQMCLANAHGSSLGASAAVVGLMAMALVWAPYNAVVFGYGVLFSSLTRVGSVEISVLMFSLLFAAFEVSAIWWCDVHLSAAVLHLLGGLLGLGLGVTLLKRGSVDCEGWDLLSIWNGAGRPSADRHTPMACGVGAKRVTERRRKHRQRAMTVSRGEAILDADSSAIHHSGRGRQGALERVRDLIRRDKPGAALRAWQQLLHFSPDAQLGQQELLRLARGLFEIGVWEEAVRLTEELAARFADCGVRLRLCAAGVLLVKLGRPKAALHMAELLDSRSLSAREQAWRERLVSEARALIDSGVIELSVSPFSAVAASETIGAGVERRP
ncbi:MAG: rhomboid family intramembrane serine protease [Planctomycetaceae bacterium]